MYLGLALLPVLMLGQQATITLSYDSAVGSDTVSFGKARCNSTQPFNYQVNLGLGAVTCSSLKFWLTDTSSCANTPNASNLDLVVEEIPQTELAAGMMKSGTIDIPINDLPAFKRDQSDGGIGCGMNTEATYRVCAEMELVAGFGGCTTNNSIVTASKSLLLVYDNQATGAPTLSEAEGGDSRVSLRVSFPTGAVKVKLQMKMLGDGGDADFHDQVELVKEGFTNITELQNGVTYSFRAYAYDAAGNQSEPSAPIEVTPKFTTGFWSACMQADCPQGCSMVGFGPLSLVALVLVTAFRRLRR